MLHQHARGRFQADHHFAALGQQLVEVDGHGFATRIDGNLERFEQQFRPRKTGLHQDRVIELRKMLAIPFQFTAFEAQSHFARHAKGAFGIEILAVHGETQCVARQVVDAGNARGDLAGREFGKAALDRHGQQNDRQTRADGRLLEQDLDRAVAVLVDEGRHRHVRYADLHRRSGSGTEASQSGSHGEPLRRCPSSHRATLSETTFNQ